jgi:hypothetical protein
LEFIRDELAQQEAVIVSNAQPSDPAPSRNIRTLPGRVVRKIKRILSNP